MELKRVPLAAQQMIGKYQSLPTNYTLENKNRIFKRYIYLPENQNDNIKVEAWTCACHQQIGLC
jgi:hypothetical protein